MAVAWSAFLLFGGLIFLLHFVHIGYMPDFNLGESVFMLGAAAVIGFYYVGALGAGLILPSTLWSSIVGLKSFRALRPKDPRRRLRLAALFLGAPLAVAALAYSLSTHQPPGARLDGPVRWVLLLLCAGPAATTRLFYLRRRRVIKRARRAGVRETRRESFKNAAWTSVKYWAVYSLSCLAFLVPFVMLYFIARRVVVEDEAARVLTLFFSLTFIVLMNVVASVVPKDSSPFLWRAVMGGIVSLSLLILLQGVASVSGAVMYVFSLGSMPNVSVVVNRDGCAILEQIDQSPAAGKGETCRLDGVNILSRLGTNYYFSRRDAGGREVRFTLPGATVLSWKVNVPPRDQPPAPPGRAEPSARP